MDRIFYPEIYTMGAESITRVKSIARGRFIYQKFYLLKVLNF
jgi:hypothetical protein